MAISVVNPVTPAIEHTKRVLFRPFDIGKWFTLGFCAFLAQLGQGGGSFNPGYNFGGGSSGQRPAPGEPPPPNPFKEMIDWVQANLVLVIVLGLIILVLVIALSAVFTWLGSRGEFLFLNGVARNRGEVVRPWKEYAREGNSLFLFRFLLGLFTFGVVLLVGALAVAVAYTDLEAGQFREGALLALLLALVLLIPFGLAIACVNIFLLDFVVPLMYLRRQTVLPAWQEFRQELLANRAGLFVLYILFKIVLGILLGLLAVVMVCATCCIAALPYLGSVITLPLTVFARSYSLYFLAQFSPEYRLIEMVAEPANEADAGWSAGEGPATPEE